MNLLNRFRRKKRIVSTPQEEKFLRLFKKYQGDRDLIELIDILVLNRMQSNALITNTKELNLANTKLSGIMQIREFLNEEDEKELPKEVQRMMKDLKQF